MVLMPPLCTTSRQLARMVALLHQSIRAVTEASKGG
jgi:adenosylmethionine-8-amino-7-oxononanoate aminotransferase